MLSYILRSNVSFNLIMMFGFVVALPYLGAVWNEFICSQ